MPATVPHDLPTSLAPSKSTFANDLPRWRRVRKGLNVDGRCSTASCEIGGGTFDNCMVRYGMNKPFVLVGENHDTPHCPTCGCPLNQLTSVSLFKCNVLIHFIKAATGESIKVKLKCTEDDGTDEIRVSLDLSDEFTYLSMTASPLIDEHAEAEAALGQLGELQVVVDKSHRESEADKTARNERIAVMASQEKRLRDQVEELKPEMAAAVSAAESLFKQVEGAEDDCAVCALAQEELDKQVEAKEVLDGKLDQEREAAAKAELEGIDRKREAAREEQAVKERKNGIQAAKDEAKKMALTWKHTFLVKIGAHLGGLGDLFNMGKANQKLPEKLQLKYEEKMKALEEELGRIDEEEAAILEHKAEVERHLQAIRQSSCDIQMQATAMQELVRKLDEIQQAISN